MSMKESLGVLGLVVALVGSGSGLAQNTTPDEAADLPVDGDWANSSIDATNTQRWYRIGLVNGRSYCVITVPHPDAADVTRDTTTDVYSDGAGTVVVSSNDDNFAEPVNLFYSRNCFVYTGATALGARLKVALLETPTGSNPIRFKVVDTALNGPWFFVESAASYNAFIEIGNTTNTAVSVTVTIRNSAGATLGTPQTVAIAAYGNTVLNVVNAFGTTVANASGSVQIAHNGAPGAIVANVTTLSAMTGLSFDAPLTRRQNW